MPNVQKAQNSPPLGLSNVPYLTVFENKGEEKCIRVHVKRYAWGETMIRSFPKPSIDRFDRQKPPSNIGEQVQDKGLSKKGRSRMRKAANYLQWKYGSTKMITCGYGNTSISGHRASKGDIDRFFKSMKRYITKQYPDMDFEYIWVAEIQEKRLIETGESVIHYHILTPYFIPKKLINNWWNNAVNRPRIKAGLSVQRLYPQIINAYHAGRYIGKYLQKEGHRIEGRGYNMAQATSKGIEPMFEITCDLTEEQAYEMEEHIFYNMSGRINGAKEIGDKTEAVYWRWMSDAPEYPFKEMVKYHLAGLESIKEIA